MFFHKFRSFLVIFHIFWLTMLGAIQFDDQLCLMTIKNLQYILLLGIGDGWGWDNF